MTTFVLHQKIIQWYVGDMEIAEDIAGNAGKLKKKCICVPECKVPVPNNTYQPISAVQMVKKLIFGDRLKIRG